MGSFVRETSAKVTFALMAGFISLQALFPTGILTSNPPQCLSAFGYRVPCGRLGIAALGHGYAGWSLAAGAATATAVWSALTRLGQQRS